MITHYAKTADVVGAIKSGLERDGLGDLILAVGSEDSGDPESSRRLLRRELFAKKEIYLPKVMVKDGADVREIDYETDILSLIDWRDFDPRPIAEGVPLDAQSAEHHSGASRSPMAETLSRANRYPVRRSPFGSTRPTPSARYWTSFPIPSSVARSWGVSSTFLVALTDSTRVASAHCRG